MSKAFWTVVTAVQVNGTWQPDLPALSSMRVTNPLDINRLLANPSAGVNHSHLIVGGLAIASDNDGTNGRHEHFVIHYNDTWFVQARYVANHVHLGNVPPDFFMCFVVCSDTDYAVLIGAPHNVRPIVQAVIDEETGEIGPLENTVWSGADATFWRNQSLTQLGVTLPAEVDRGVRMVAFLAGLLQARRVTDERALRNTQV